MIEVLENVPKLSKDGCWTQEFLRQLYDYVDNVIENPALTISSHVAFAKNMTEYEDYLSWQIVRPYHHYVTEAIETDKQERTPETYIQVIIMERRFQWLERFIDYRILSLRGQKSWL